VCCVCALEKDFVAEEFKVPIKSSELLVTRSLAALEPMLPDRLFPEELRESLGGENAWLSLDSRGPDVSTTSLRINIYGSYPKYGSGVRHSLYVVRNRLREIEKA
jgi:hypothetical protein